MMVRSAFVLALALASCGARAATPLDDLVAPPFDGKSACFSRAYDAAHLKAHPKQKIAAMKAWLLYRREKSTNPPTLDIGLEISQRGDAQPLFASGNCYWDEGVNRERPGPPPHQEFQEDRRHHMHDAGATGRVRRV